MRNKVVCLARCAMLFAVSIAAGAQQPGRAPRIGFLHGGSMSVRLPHLEAFRQGLREHGYIEGKNIAIEVRFAEGKLDQLPNLAADLLALKVDVIAAGTTRAMLAAKKGYCDNSDRDGGRERSRTKRDCCRA